MNRGRVRNFLVFFAFLLAATIPAWSQATTAGVEGRVTDATGALLPKANVTVVSGERGISRSTATNEVGVYRFSLLPVGEYTVTAELAGFRKEAKKITLSIGALATVDFSLAVGEVAQEVKVEAIGEAAEPTRSMVSTVIAEREIQSLPVNGRQFIDFALLAPGVSVGNTTSGSTDVIIEPVTKISFAGQNIHYHFIAVDGADNISTASGVQKTSPSQEAVREFRVVNSSYSTEFGRAVGGIVNIITKSGTNDFHGSVYEYFRNDALDATGILQSPGLSKLRQNQFGVTMGGPIRRDKSFLFGNYEGQRRHEHPFYNSVILNNISDINTFKTNFGLPVEPDGLNVTRTADYNNFVIKWDHLLSERNNFFVRYFFNDQNALNVSPLNDGFDLPSAFKDNSFRDHSIVGGFNSTLSPTLSNELRVQFGHRFFDFPTVTTQPHLEVANTFAVGVNRGNPDFYREWRFEVVDNVSKTWGNHTLSFGGNFNLVNTEESFPLFYPFEATFGCLYAVECPFSMELAQPFVIFMQRNDTASNFTEPTLIPGGTAVYAGRQVPQQIRDLARGEIRHTYTGFYVQDKWRPTPDLTLNFGIRWEFETWPDHILDNDMDNVDPRVGFAYRIGTSRNIVLRGGAGMFHGTIPSPLLMCQIPSCGGVLGEYPGREDKENELNATTRLFAFASSPFITGLAMTQLLGQLAPNVGQAIYPDVATAPAADLCFPGMTSFSQCGFFGDSVIVRFAKDHQAPYGIQGSLGIEFDLFKDSTLNISYLGVRSKHLGSFFNINQPSPINDPLCTLATVHDSLGNAGTKNTFGGFVPGQGCLPFGADPQYAVFFEADSRWSAAYDGLLVNFNKRMGKYFGMGASYTWSKGIDNGPNPSFVLIPQDNSELRQERAVSSDHVAHRFVANTTFRSPTQGNALVKNWEFGTILTLESPHYFTKFAGFDANLDIFGVNDRVGIEPRNTFQGDGYQSIDMRVSRVFNLTERVKFQAIAEAFNLLNTVNVRYFNTTYGAADFCDFATPGTAGCPLVPSGNLENAPNPNYGRPRAIHNPRQLQFAFRFTW